MFILNKGRKHDPVGFKFGETREANLQIKIYKLN